MRSAQALLVALILALVVWSPALSARNDPASIYNGGGLGAWVEGGRLGGSTLHVLHGPVADLDPARDALLVVAPRVGYREAEAIAFERFLTAGGRALVVDDAGASRQLLARLDVDILDSRVYSTSYARNPAWPIMEPTGPMLPQTIMSRPHVVAGQGEVLLASHAFSWQDLDNDLGPDLGEPIGAWPVAMREDVGQGQVIVVGDADLFLQDVSQPTARILLDWLAADRTVVVDEGHRAATDPIQSTPLLAGARPALAAMLAAAVLVGALVAGLDLHIRRARPRTAARRQEDPALAELPDGS